MNPWKTLNIDPTDDKKIIKKAYAKLIKQYKPDEYPEKFQEIQQAYQMALSSMHYNQKIIENQESSQINDEIIKESKKETFELSEKKLFEHKQDSAFQKQQQELIDNLYAQLHAMAFAPLVVKNKLDNWKFIEDFYQIDDLTLKDEVAKTVFKKVAEYNLFQMKQNNTLLINPVTLSYFDKTFDWRTKWGEYVNVFPDHYFKVTIDSIHQNNKTDSWLSSFYLIFRRSMSFSIELLFFIGAMYAITRISNPSDEFSPHLFGFFLYMMISEAFAGNRISTGKEIFSLMVLDQYGNVCSRFQSVARNIFFYFMVIFPLYIWLKINNLIVIPFVIYFFVVFSLYLITFFLTKKLLQDFATKTIVIKK